MGHRARLATPLFVGWMAVACVAAPASAPPTFSTPAPSSPSQTEPPSPSPTPMPLLGEPLAAVERPDKATCDRLQRHDRVAAERIRTSIGLTGRGVAASDAAIAAAAGDPTADIEAMGIPLRTAEMEFIRKDGMYLDNRAPIAFWVNAGRVDLFGGIWIDPPGSDRVVVSVVDGTREALELGRCLERDGLDVRYVMATHSLLELREVHERINRDRVRLEAEGIKIISSGEDTPTNRITIEVEELTAEATQLLTERYGDAILLESIPAPTPYVQLKFDQVPLAVGTDTLFSEARNDGRQGTHGTWELMEGGVADGKLRLRIAIEPPPHGLPVTSGPAVLFAGMEAFGGAGDVGFNEPIDALAIEALSACDDRDCRYEAEVVLPTDEILPAVRRLEAGGMEVTWVSVNLTLVRTFAGGTWLQVLPLDAGDDDTTSGRAGRLGAIEPVASRIFPFGLFPADQATAIGRGGDGTFTTAFDYPRVIERKRKKLGDESEPLPAVRGRLHADIDPPCQGAAHLTLHNDSGDRVFDTKVHKKRSIDASFSIPPTRCGGLRCTTAAGSTSTRAGRVGASGSGRSDRAAAR